MSKKLFAPDGVQVSKLSIQARGYLWQPFDQLATEPFGAIMKCYLLCV